MWLQSISAAIFVLNICIYLADSPATNFNRMIKHSGLLFFSFLFLHGLIVSAQTPEWIRPASRTSPSIWGLKGGIVFSIWPYGVETDASSFGGGPRGLIRVGYEFKGKIYLINFLAIEPVVNGKIEFSEISPSQVDQKWGKLMWASGTRDSKTFEPYSSSPGVIDTIRTNNSVTEKLSVYFFIEKFDHGAHPYLRLSITSDRPEEVGIEVFEKEGSAKMDRCVITATMGNYARLRNIYLKEQVINSKKLFENYNDIHFVEKESYPYTVFLKDRNGDFIVPAATDETFAGLSAWPQEEAYLDRVSWRYRPPFQLTQYWRKESSRFDSSLKLRVNGRTFYWAGGVDDKSKYIRIPGGTAFENFELRENFYPGQKFYFGITRKTVPELLK